MHYLDEEYDVRYVWNYGPGEFGRAVDHLIDRRITDALVMIDDANDNMEDSLIILSKS